MAFTFRISNIPFGISKADIEGDLKVTFPEAGATGITLRSLAPSPSDPMKGQIAIVTFNPVPIRLKESEEQRLQIRMKRENRVKSQYLVNFDSHFIGLTPLNETSSKASFE